MIYIYDLRIYDLFDYFFISDIFYNSARVLLPLFGKGKPGKKRQTMEKKRYEAVGLNAARFVFKYKGVKVTARFEGGNKTLGRNAVLETSNPVVQAAIENDRRFGQIIIRSY